MQRPKKTTKEELENWGTIHGTFQLLHVAKEACTHCSRPLDPLVSVFFSHTFLEACINDILLTAKYWMEPPHGEDIVPYTQEEEKTLSTLADLAHLSVGQKWNVPLHAKYDMISLVFKQKRLDWKKEPFSDFKLLTGLRNWLVHTESVERMVQYKGSEKSIIPKRSGRVILGRLLSKGLISEEKEGSPPSPSINIVSTKKVACWAYNTAVKVAILLPTFIPENVFSDHFYIEDKPIDLPDN